MKNLILIIVLLFTLGCNPWEDPKVYPKPFSVGSKVRFKEGEQEYTVIHYGFYGDGDGYWSMKIGYGDGYFRTVGKDEFSFLEQVKQ